MSTHRSRHALTVNDNDVGVELRTDEAASQINAKRRSGQTEDLFVLLAEDGVTKLYFIDHTGTPSAGGGGGGPTSLRADVFANIGAAGTAGAIFYATDTFTLYRDNGSIWVAIVPGLDGGGHIPVSQLPNIPESQVTNLTTDLGNKQPLASQLTTFAGYNTNGLFTQTAAGTYTGRTLTAGSGKITVTNGNGVGGNPIVDVGTLAETDITNLSTDLASLQTTGAVNSANLSARTLADAGQYVCTGGALSPSATSGKLDLAAGTDFMATTEFNYAAQTAIATTITSMADATNPKWVIVELDSSGTVQFNQGSAAANPVFPAFTSNRTPHGYLYIPANATQVDTLLTTNNGLAKLIDARIVRSTPRSRLFATDTAQTALTNPTVLTTLLAAAPTVPANSLNVGDTFRISASGLYKNTQNNSTLEIKVLFGTGVFDLTTASLTLDASNFRRWTLDMTYTVTAIGASATGLADSRFWIAPAAAATTGTELSGLGGGTAGDGGVGANGNAATYNSTAAQTIDLQAKIGTSSTTATVNLRHFSVEKVPAV